MLSFWLSLAEFGYLWLSLSQAEPTRHDAASIAAGDILRPAMTLRNFQYRPYSQYLSFSFKNFPFFDRAPNQADTLPRQYKNRHSRKAMMS
jgi:hypothetical protein